MIRLLLLGMILCIALAGCGGNDGGLVQSKYAGHWMGNWAEDGSEWSGTFDLNIANNGSITGISHDNIEDAPCTITGAITSAGLMSITFNYQTWAIHASGTASIATNGHLVSAGLVAPADESYFRSIAIDLTKQL